MRSWGRDDTEPILSRRFGFLSVVFLFCISPGYRGKVTSTTMFHTRSIRAFVHRTNALVPLPSHPLSKGGEDRELFKTSSLKISSLKTWSLKTPSLKTSSLKTSSLKTSSLKHLISEPRWFLSRHARWADTARYWPSTWCAVFLFDSFRLLFTRNSNIPFAFPFLFPHNMMNISMDGQEKVVGRGRATCGRNQTDPADDVKEEPKFRMLRICQYRYPQQERLTLKLVAVSSLRSRWWQLLHTATINQTEDVIGIICILLVTQLRLSSALSWLVVDTADDREVWNMPVRWQGSMTFAHTVTFAHTSRLVRK